MMIITTTNLNSSQFVLFNTDWMIENAPKIGAFLLH